MHRPESLGSLRRGEPGVGGRERDDSEQEARAPRHPPLCWWLAWGGSPSHLGSYVAPCQGHPFFLQPPSPVMGTLPLPAPLSPPPIPTPPPPPNLDWYGRLPFESWSKFSLLKPTGSLELEESFPFSAC